MRKRGVSMVEMLAAMSVVAFAVSLLAPAVVNATARSRRAQCANNLRQIGRAWLDHEQSHHFLPSSGWGWRWVGDPDRGFGRHQPGGWAYDVLRFTEYAEVANRGAGAATDQEKATGMLSAVTTPIPLFYCPNRRDVRTYPVVRNGDLANNLRECRAQSCNVARTDYQANSGNIAAGETGGPRGDRSTSMVLEPYTQHSGVTHHVSQLRLSQIEDGISKTICVGEKYLNADNYLDGNTPGDDQCLFSGIDRELNGYTASATSTSSPGPVSQYLPRRDRPGLSLNWTFGSSHDSGFYVVNCDNSVRFLAYGIDFLVFSRMGGRADGQPPQ